MISEKKLRYAIFAGLAALCIIEFVYIPQYGQKLGAAAIPFWQQPLQVIFFHEIYLLSPLLVKPINFILCWTLGLGFWFGFRQISDHNVLDHPERIRIYVFIRDHPGIHFREMERDTGINRGTLSYHLEMLVQAKKILALECGGYRRYFENTGKYSPLERKILASLTDVNKRRILQMMIQSPVTQSDMRDQLHLSVPSIVWHIHRLCDEQLVIKNDSLRPAQYLLKDEVSQFLRTTVFFTSQE